MTAASPSPDTHDVELGTVLDGRYRIDAVLGTGGMGCVYRGEHTGIGRPVAIKVLHADLNRNREAAQRFQREAIASGRLDHPNIVGVSDFGVLESGSCYLVMEVLEGESLGTRLERERRIPWPEALAILRGVLRGLHHAHERGVVHRDIKPDNIFLARKDDETVVKILDFGIAKLYAGSADDPASTRAGITVGTPAYLSPEQAVGGEIKPASDIYSTSIVLYEMLTGRPPFEDEDPLAMLGAHVSRPPPPFAERAPDLDVPPEVEALIDHGLAKIAAERIGSANDYIAQIDAILAAKPRGGVAALIASELGGAPALGTQQTDLAIATSMPGNIATPVPGGEAGVVTPLPRAATPFPQLATPVPGTVTPVPGTATPVPNTPTPGTATPVPGTVTPVPGGMHVARAIRAVSIADAAPIPRRWLVRGAVIAAITIAVVLLLILLRGGKSDHAKSGSTDRSVPTRAAPTPTLLSPTPVYNERDDEEHQTKLKAALYELKEGKTCEDRRAAISDLLDLDDPAAIPDLKRARYRMRGGVLGIGDSNTNGCLRKDAEEAIQELSRNLPDPPPRKRGRGRGRHF